MSIFKHTPPSFTLQFQDGQIVTAGSTVSGSVTLDVANTKCEELTIKIRGKQRSTYYRSYGQTQDIRTQYTDIYGEEVVVWRRSTEQVASSSATAIREEKSDTSVEEAPSYSSKDVEGGAPSGLHTFLFSFTIPSLNAQRPSPFPPSFSAGNRGFNRYEGEKVGKNYYFIKVTGTKQGIFTSNERIIIPFVYLPPDPVQALTVPPPIFPHGETSLPPTPPPAPSGPSWQSFNYSQPLRSGLFSKKGVVDVTVTIPSMHQFPRGEAVPIYTSLRILSKHSSTSTSTVPSLPSPSGVKLVLERQVWTHAKGASQVINAKVPPGDVCDVDKQRAWYGQPQVFKHDGEEMFGCEIVLVNEMMFKVAPSFERGTYHLACAYFLSFTLPISGLTNNLNFECCQINVTSGVKLGEDGVIRLNNVEEIVPPSYFDAIGDHDDEGVGENEKKGFFGREK